MTGKAWKGVLAAAALALLLYPLAAREAETLPDYMNIDIKRLEETWNILDRFAERIWPGWDNYRDVPFRFSYPNGVEMVVGHDDPPDTFRLVPGVRVQDKKVHLDRTREIALRLRPPLRGGGGVLKWGKSDPVYIVDLNMSGYKEPEEHTEGLPEEHLSSSEFQILTNIHELFHCYQRSVYTYRFGNYRVNPDGNMAVYSEIEGRALERAFLAEEEKTALRFLKDFVAARRLKRKDLLDRERSQESEDDLMEGTAEYAEAMALNLIKQGYSPVLSREDDPWFRGFAYVDALIQSQLDFLREQTRAALDARSKCYPYGCFQALLLTRLFPGWQKDFFAEKTFLDQMIGAKLAMSDEEMDTIAGTLRTRYDYEEIFTRNTRLIGRRDEALSLIQGRKGRTYVVNFKPVGEFLAPEWRGESYTVGLMVLAPSGLKSMTIRDISMEGAKTPLIQDQLYYIKWVDTETPPDEQGYSLEHGGKEGEDTFRDAVFKTKGFLLKAPLIRIKERPGRIKVTVLSKIREQR